MKHMMSTLVASTIAMALTACGNNITSSATSASGIAVATGTESVVDSSMAVSKTDGSTPLTSAEWPANAATALVPKPTFNAKMTSMNVQELDFSISSTGTWEGATEEDIAVYVQDVKDAGFTYNVSEMTGTDGYFYNAYNTENLSGEHCSIDIQYLPGVGNDRESQTCIQVILTKP